MSELPAAKRVKRLDYDELSFDKIQSIINDYFFNKYDKIYHECLLQNNYSESINKLIEFKFGKNEFVLVYSFIDGCQLIRKEHRIVLFIVDILKITIQKLFSYIRTEKENLIRSYCILYRKKHTYNIIITTIYMLNIFQKFNKYYYRLYTMDKYNMIIELTYIINKIESFIIETYNELFIIILTKNNIFVSSADITKNILITYNPVPFCDTDTIKEIEAYNLTDHFEYGSRYDRSKYKDFIEKRINALLSLVKKII